MKTVAHFAPTFWSALASVKDFRNPVRIVYSIQEELLVGVMMFMLKTGARRNIKFKLATPEFIQNLQVIGRQIYPGTVFPDTLLCGDTLNYLLSGIGDVALPAVRTEVIRSLLRKRCLEPFRIQGLYYPVAIDGTGYLTFKSQHCSHCLTRTKDGKTTYFHHVLEAKLALGNGFALSIGTEFIENERPDVPKQDCERKAFFRLAQRLKQDFPQLKMCLLLDGLYACQTVFDQCRLYHWPYLITFKEGSMPAVFADYQALLKLVPQHRRVAGDKTLRQTFRWVNDIAYESHRLNVLECLEETPEGSTRFVWLSFWTLNTTNVESIANQGARRRWVIENQGFNVQKTGGYALEHAYSTHNTAMKNFYALLQIAHIFNQLMEKGSLLRDHLKNSMGSLKVFSAKLWAAFTMTRIDPVALQTLCAQRIQIRFNSS
ncbi:MAG TPA: transposase [Elusimicrobiota bacterium]|nr:transposase [Elusimicrobiota bacterium]